MTESPISDGAGASKEKRRILYVHNSADLYGASRSLLRLLQVLDRTRFQALVVLPESGILSERIEQLGVRVVIDPSLAIVSRYSSKFSAVFWRFPISVWRLFTTIRREGIDLVHTNSAVIFSPATAAWLAGVPHVWHVRESFEEFPRPLWELYSAYLRRFSARIISVSTANAAQFNGLGKVEVIHNGFPLENFLPATPSACRDARLQFGFDHTDVVVGCVGRIKWVRKGQEYLVQALQLLKQRGLSVKCLIVGSPYLGNENHLTRLHALVEELGLKNQVVFAGELKDTRPAYLAVDLFVLPSAQPEPFGGVVIEAMAYRLPVIATAIGGSLDQVEDNLTGFLVPPGDANALAEKIAILTGDSELRTRMGAAGRARAEKLFDLPQMGRKVEELYEQVLRRRD